MLPNTRRHVASLLEKSTFEKGTFDEIREFIAAQLDNLK